jgi:hypothetical protein
VLKLLVGLIIALIGPCLAQCLDLRPGIVYFRAKGPSLPRIQRGGVIKESL